MANTDFFGQEYTVFGPEPAGRIGSPKSSDKPKKHDPYFDTQEEIDSRVKWARKAESELLRAGDAVRQMVKRNWRFYRGEHWDLSERPKWKIASKLNYVFWAVEYWTALLTDSKPRSIFTPYNRRDSELASLLTGAWNEWYEAEDAQHIFEQAVLLSQIEMVSYLYWYYEPRGRDNRGVIKARNVSVENLFMDKLATSPDDANVLMYRYSDTRGSILARYPKLADRLTDRDAEEAGDDKPKDDGVYRNLPGTTTNPNTDQSIYTTGSGPSNTGGPIIQNPQYRAHSSPPSDLLKDEIMVKEFWCRHKGPEYDCEIKQLTWTAGNEVATKPRLIKKADKTMEPLQRITMAVGIVYELPMSVCAMLQHLSDLDIGAKVLSVKDSLEAIKHKVMVPKYPNGRRLVIVGDYVADDGANPYAHGRFPFAEVSANPNPKDPIGTNTVNQIIDPQDYLNRLYSLFLDAALLTANPMWRLPLSEDIDDDELTNAPGSIVRETTQSLKLGRREGGPEMPQYVMNLLQLTIAQIKEISGITENVTGAKAKAQVSSDTVNMMQEQAGVRFRKASRNVDRAIVRSGELFKGLVSQFYTDTRYVTMRNAAGVDETRLFTGTAMTAPMRMAVKSGSMLPQSPSERLKYLMQSAGAPWGDMSDILRGIEEYGYITSAVDSERRLDEAVDSFVRSTANGGPPDLRKIYKFPGLMQMLMGGQKKKPGAPNGGRAVRGRTSAAA